MEIFFFIILLVSILGNLYSVYVMSNLLNKNVSVEKQLYSKNKEDLVPFISPMKDADQFDLSEVDDEVLKKSVKETITRLDNSVKDDEAEAVIAKEFMA